MSIVIGGQSETLSGRTGKHNLPLTLILFVIVIGGQSETLSGRTGKHNLPLSTPLMGAKRMGAAF
ncbi:MAG: hypothetical protein O4806_11670, partial [Trichodesmium sp. St5_bin8]|nr:hypothetical protein [Trichodesmium sp. St5_bin8]